MKMPQIDVTDILLDPFIAGETFVVLRRLETVNSFGESVVLAESFNAIGSVVPMGDQSLTREGAFEVQSKTIRVITATRLRGASKDGTKQSFQPDVILWRSDYFVVSSIDDYTRYGGGFNEAECRSIDHVDVPPMQLIPAFGWLNFSRPGQSGLIAGIAPCN
jgi:hypothetical protein